MAEREIWFCSISQVSISRVLFMTTYLSLTLLSLWGYFCPQKIWIYVISERLLVLTWNLMTFPNFYLRLFCWKRNWKNITFSGGNIFFFQGYCQNIGVQIWRNSFSRRNKYVHLWEVVGTSSLNFVKRLWSTFCWPAIIIYRPDFCKFQTNK